MPFVPRAVHSVLTAFKPQPRSFVSNSAHRSEPQTVLCAPVSSTARNVCDTAEHVGDNVEVPDQIVDAHDVGELALTADAIPCSFPC
eukprot:2367991-Amphidinium_carterae.1